MCVQSKSNLNANAKVQGQAKAEAKAEFKKKVLGGQSPRGDQGERGQVSMVKIKTGRYGD